MKEYNNSEEIRRDIKENALTISACRKNIRKLKKMIAQRSKYIFSRKKEQV